MGLGQNLLVLIKRKKACNTAAIRARRQAEYAYVSPVQKIDTTGFFNMLICLQSAQASFMIILFGQCDTMYQGPWSYFESGGGGLNSDSKCGGRGG